MIKYLSFAQYLRQKFGHRVQKVPLDAGFSCPNRDGTLSTRGCIFCNPRGSGSGLRDQGLSLAQQWDRWTSFYQRRSHVKAFLGYLQSFSNTYGPAERLATVLAELRPLPGLAGMAIGTRPDCVDEEKIHLLASQPVEEVWLELGLQSSNDETLRRINRGHNAACFAHATRMAAAAGLKICAHVIAGLPGEGLEELLETVRFLNALPVHGVKFHNLYICRGTQLALDYKAGSYVPLSQENYVDWLCQALNLLRGDIVVQRLTGDPAPGELVAPFWAGEKHALIQKIHNRLKQQD